MNDYIKVVYDSEKRPYTGYPYQLAEYLFKRFDLQKGDKLLEPGCGRGEFLKSFKELGLDVYGIDLYESAIEFQPEIPIKISDLEKDGFPYPDNYFDVVYSKSLLEHLYEPDKYFCEAYRVLKPGGKLITLVPDWESNYKIYFDDYTHRSPFTVVSLEDIYSLTGFESGSAYKFRQLPVVWKHSYLNIICRIISPFVPVRSKNKFLRWSRELMLVGYGQKPR